MERQWTPERWLNPFGTVCVAFHVVLWTVFAAATPIVTLPPFVDLPHSSSGAASPASEGDAIVSVRRTGETYDRLTIMVRAETAALQPPTLASALPVLQLIVSVRDGTDRDAAWLTSARCLRTPGSRG